MRLAGFVIVAGQEYRLTQYIAHDYTFSAILIAFLARFNPLAVVPTAFVVAGLFTAGETLKTFYQLPLAIVLVVQSLILLSVVSIDFFARYKLSMQRRADFRHRRGFDRVATRRSLRERILAPLACGNTRVLGAAAAGLSRPHHQ